MTVAYIADECPGAEGVRATGIYAIGTIVGGFGGRFIAGWTGQFVGWRAGFLVLAAITLVAARRSSCCCCRGSAGSARCGLARHPGRVRRASSATGR